MADAYNTSTSFADFTVTKIHDAAMLEFTDFTNNAALQLAFDCSPFFSPGVSNIKVPYMQDTNLQSVTEGTAIDRTQYSSTVRTLTATTHAADIAPITDKALVLNLIQNQMWTELGKLYGAAAKKTVDAAILGNYTASASDVTNATTADIDEDDILAAKLILDNANAPETGRFLIVTPKQYGKLAKIARFSQWDTTGQAGIITSGKLPMIHGVAIFMDQNVVTSSGLARNIMGVRGSGIMDSSLHFAMQKFVPMVSGIPTIGDMIRFSFSRNAPYLSDEMTCEIMYGTAALRSEWVVEIQSQD